MNYIDINNKYYPNKLKSIKNPPKKLYYKGNLELLKEDAIAVIGSRKLTEYGKRYEKIVVKELALRDIVIVSGLALGADSVAHEETLNFNGKTIAVMGSGFSNIFPKENINIYERILSQNGLVLTEYDDDIKPISKNFPERNRIVSGLSVGVLVVEATCISGTSITANLAWNQGRKVYAFPGRLDSKQGMGVNRLIQKGAKLVISVQDIIEDFPDFLSRKKRLVIQNKQVKKEYRKIYNLLSEFPVSLDEIAIKTNNTVNCTAKLLSLMELDDLITEVVGIGYVKK